MIINDDKFALIEGRISSIQAKLDSGLVLDEEYGIGAVQALREARVELFKLRTLLQEIIEVEPTAAAARPA